MPTSRHPRDDPRPDPRDDPPATTPPSPRFFTVSSFSVLFPFFFSPFFGAASGGHCDDSQSEGQSFRIISLSLSLSLSLFIFLPSCSPSNGREGNKFAHKFSVRRSVVNLRANSRKEEEEEEGREREREREKPTQTKKIFGRADRKELGEKEERLHVDTLFLTPALMPAMEAS